jgi:hypothetical protein
MILNDVENNMTAKAKKSAVLLIQFIPIYAQLIRINEM